MKAIGLEELKRIQLEILDVIHKFCIENNIHYSLGCGSMLGAARHKGFIPWDDDIDIYLLREEYNKLISLFPEIINNIKLGSLERDSQWNRPYAKAYDNRTEIIDAGNPYRIGIGIDVFPIDKVPEDDDTWKKYDRKRRIYQRIFELKISMIFRKGRAPWKYVFLPFTKLLLSPFTVRQIGVFLDKYSRKYENTDSSQVFECCQGIKIKNKFKRKTLENVVETAFEDRIYLGMKEYDDYLSNAYGNWRQLPPKEKQVTHHIFKAWWK